MAADLNQKELEKVLEALIELMIRKGILPPGLNKQKLVEDVTEKLMSAKNTSGLELNNNNLHNPNIIKALATACCAQLQPQNKFDYTLLFKSQVNLKEDDVKKELKNIFTEMLQLKLEGNKASSKDEDLMKEKLNEVADVLSDKLFKSNDNNLLCENEQLMNIMAGCVDAKSESELRRQFYGVGEAGEVPRVETQYIGNLIGAQDLESSITGSSFMAQQDNPYTADPIGFKIDELIKAITSNPVDTDVERQVMEKNLAPSTAPKPSPFK